jgi:hypothetical protein
MIDEDDVVDVKRALEVISQKLNRSGEKEVKKAVSEFLRCEHRTLQQLYMGNVVIPSLFHFRDSNSDLRNEASCKLSRKMLYAVTEDDLSLPFI